MLKLLTIFLLSFCFISMAEASDPAHAEPAPGAAPAADGHAAPAKEVSKGPPRKTYAEAQQSVMNAKAGVAQRTGAIAKLFEEKHKTKDQVRATEIAKEISKEYKGLVKAQEELNLKIDELRFQYPEKNQGLSKTYERSTAPSIEDIELGLGVDRQLDEVKMKMKAQYAPPKVTVPEPTEPAETHREPASEHPAIDDSLPQEEQRILISK